LAADDAGRQLAVASRLGSLTVYDVETGSIIAQKSVSNLRKLAHQPGTSQWLGGSTDGDIRLFVQTGPQLSYLAQVTLPSGAPITALLGLGSNRVLAGSQQGDLALLDSAGGRLKLLSLVKIPGKPGIHEIALRNGKAYLAAGKGLLSLPLNADGLGQPSIVATFDKLVRTVATHPSGQLVVGGNDKTLRVINPDTLTESA
jgi:WD40 repeat protein